MTRLATASCRGFSAACLASVPDGQCLMADLRPKSPRLWLDELHHWQLCHHCIALDLAVYFKLYLGIRAWTQIWVHIQLGSSGPHCTKRANDLYSPAGFELGLVTDFPPLIPTIIDFWVIDLMSSPVWWEADTNIAYCGFGYVLVNNGAYYGAKFN